MQPYRPNAPSRTENMIAVLRTRSNDKLSLDAADELERLRDQEFKLARRIHQQRIALRSNWEIIEARAAYKKAWYRSPLLTSILIKSRKQPWWQRYLRQVFALRTTRHT